MRKSFFIAFFTIAFCLKGFAQSCLPNGITFSTQAQIDNFQINYPGCAAISGGVTISGADITNLTGLSQLTFIGGFNGNFDIANNPLLTNLNGLENLTVAGYALTISNNASLTSMEGLNAVTQAFHLDINNNPALLNMNGLGNLKWVGERVSIYGNASLTSLSGLNLEGVGFGIEISDNPSLTTLDGLESLTIDSALHIRNNPQLADISGLQNLVKVKGPLEFENNDALLNLSGLENLEAIGYLEITNNNSLLNLEALGKVHKPLGSLKIAGNNALTSLNGLRNIPSVSDYFNIMNNPALSDCSIFAVCNILLNEPNPIVQISNNAPGCDNKTEAAASCQSSPVTVFVTLNNNGNPVSLENIQVSLSSASQMNLKPTDANGIARFAYLDNGGFDISLPQVSVDKWQINETYVIYTAFNGLDSTLAFLELTPLISCPELSVHLGMPSFFRGCLVTSGIEVSTQNTGTAIAEGAKVAVVLPPVLELLASTPPFDAQSGDTLFFDLGDLLPFGKSDIKLTVRTKCDTFVLGQTLCIETFAAMDNACPTTTQPLSEIKLSAKCINGNTVRFTVKNIGDAPTQGWHEYRIIRNDAIQYNNGFSLAAQQSLSFDFPADGTTWRMEATKFDDGTETAVALENCGGLTPGLINAFWLDHGPLEYDFDCRQVIGSFDPNLKSAVPTGVGPSHSITANQPIQYTIDFQNTGSDTAYRVLLRDVLSSNFDLNTFRPGYSSHPCTWEIKGNTLEVLFSPIALPDSNVNEPASHGFFSFDIDQKPNLPQGTYFENTANIIFDFNPPIYTNYVWHYIGHLTVKVDEPQTHADLWQVLGNPTRDVATFRAMEEIAGEKQFDLYDAAGRLVRSAQFSGQVFEFQRDMLEVGVYFFRIVEEKGRVFSGRIVVMD
jgi:uncharacterized repeat protein (TIGR01451 family)